MPQLTVRGKGVYIWKPDRIGSPQEVAEELARSGTRLVAIKLVDGSYQYPNLEPYIAAIRAKGIVVGGWGYVYLKFNAIAEANATVAAIQRHQPAFYLIDAEAYAKAQWVAAKVYASLLRRGVPNVPLGLNSYWYPEYHPTLPWQPLREISDFDAPQVYWRGYRPTQKLIASKAQYAAMKPRLPFALPAGDMYFERNVKPTPAQVTDFLTACKNDPEIQGCLMWSMDQKKVVPELWAAYSGFDWKTGESQEPITVPAPAPQPLYLAVVNAWRGLNVRVAPTTSGNNPIRAERRGTLIEVFGVESGWAWIKPDKSEWMSASYLTQV